MVFQFSFLCNAVKTVEVGVVMRRLKYNKRIKQRLTCIYVMFYATNYLECGFTPHIFR